MGRPAQGEGKWKDACFTKPYAAEKVTASRSEAVTALGQYFTCSERCERRARLCADIRWDTAAILGASTATGIAERTDHIASQEACWNRSETRTIYPTATCRLPIPPARPSATVSTTAEIPAASDPSLQWRSLCEHVPVRPWAAAS